MGNGARDRILGRIRTATETRAAPAHPGASPSTAPGGDAAERFALSLAHSGGEVLHLGDLAQATAWMRDFASGFSGAVVSEWVPPALRPGISEAPASTAELGVSVALAAAAATGSLVLSSHEGRSLQLLPPVHVVWIERARIYQELGDALEAVRAAAELPPALALHSGPSKSADIGRILVTGVHGPGRLVAVVTDFSLGAS